MQKVGDTANGDEDLDKAKMARQLKEQQERHAAAERANQAALQELNRQLHVTKSATVVITHEKQVSKLALSQPPPPCLLVKGHSKSAAERAHQAALQDFMPLPLT